MRTRHGRIDTMSATPSLLPALHTLRAGLTVVFCAHESPDAGVTVLDREPIRVGTFASEIVRCQVPDGRQLHLFCKYGSGHKDNVYGHRGGVPYEAEIYRRVLQPIQATTPTLYGAQTDATTGDTWLILGYMDKSIHLNKAPEPLATVSQAGRWIGQFHAATEAHLSTTAVAPLNRYDTAYYLG